MTHRTPRNAAITLVSILTMFTALATQASAAQNPNPRWYIPTMSQSTLSAGATTNLTFTIRNAYRSALSLGSANIRIPAGFTIVGDPAAPVLSGDQTWSSSLNGPRTIIQLRNPGPKTSQRLNFGDTVQVSFDVQVPCAAGKYTWTSQVRNTNDFSNNGKTFIVAPGNGDPKTTVSGECSDHVAFSQQPVDTLEGTTMAPVKVSVTDNSANPVSGVNVTLSLGTDPTGTATLSGTLMESTDGSGVATFSDLSIDNSSSGYQLLATVASVTPVLSDTFAITSTSSDCTDCTATFPSGGTVSGPPGTTLIIETNQLSCDSVSNPIAGTVTIIPPDGSGPTQIVFDDTVSFPITGSYPFCKSPDLNTPGANVVDCDSIPNGLNQTDGTVPCVQQSIILHGSNPPTLHTILWIEGTDPVGKH